MTDFDLGALVREVCEVSNDADPGVIAKHVNHRIKPRDRDTALEQALVLYVTRTISRSRHSVVIPLTTPGGHRERESPTSPATGGHKSHEIREAWRRMLRDRLPVGPEPGAWRFLADCTATDLEYAASIRDEHARRNASRAQQYRNLAALVERHGVGTVGELPEDVLAPTLTATE